MKRRIVIVSVLGLLAFGGAFGAVMDRGCQRDRFEALRARTAALALRADHGEADEADARSLYYETLATEDRWIGSEMNALRARLRALISQVESQHREREP